VGDLGEELIEQLGLAVDVADRVEHGARHAALIGPAERPP
jgi:hypothetical protein